jgi:AraC-like DNA-binding protein
MLSLENHLLVFMLDNFENIFTIDNSNKLTIEMSNFLKEFGKLESGNNRLILGIKEDFLGNLYHFSREIHGFYTEEAFYYLKNFERMSAGEVMVKTIERMNLPVDEQLIETILDDLTQREDTIYPPLINIILSQLSKRHRARYLYGSKKNPLNLSFYKNTGGAAAILLDYAKEKLEELSEEEQYVSIEIIQKMVTPFFTRQRIRHREIVELNDNRVDIEKLLQRLLRLRFIKRIQTTDAYEYELIHDFLKGLVPTNPTVTGVKDTSSFIREAIAYIDSNYYRPISLQEVAKNVGVTPEHLSRQFKSEFKIGFKEYVTQKRIEEAKQLLLRFPELSINELSQRAGFTSSQHFINVFKSETHYTPLKFRQKSLLHPDSADKSNMRSH